MKASKRLEGKFKVQSDIVKLPPAVLEVIEIARSHEVECWLNYGALLGLVRENRLLPWNNDVELTCWVNSNTTKQFKMITDELNRIGYYTVFYSTIGAISAKKKGVIVNINGYWKEGEYCVRPHEKTSGRGMALFLSKLLYWIGRLMGAYPGGVTTKDILPLSMKGFIRDVSIRICRILPKAVRKYIFLLCMDGSIKCGGIYQKTAIPADYFKLLVNYKFYDGEVLVPKDPEKLLRFIYGKEWAVPQENWSFYSRSNQSVTGIIFLDEIWEYSQMDIV